MCLYIGLKSKFIAEHDIIVYKKLSEVSGGGGDGLLLIESGL